MKRPLPDLPPVAAFQVAPYLYRYSAPVQDTYAQTWREVKDAAPYKAGDVIYAVDGDGYRRVFVVSVDVDRGAYGDWREFYWVRPETKAGTFAKRKYKAYSGFIQRGYQRALGLDSTDTPA